MNRERGDLFERDHDRASSGTVGDGTPRLAVTHPKLLLLRDGGWGVLRIK